MTPCMTAVYGAEAATSVCGMGTKKIEQGKVGGFLGKQQKEKDRRHGSQRNWKKGGQAGERRTYSSYCPQGKAGREPSYVTTDIGHSPRCPFPCLAVPRITRRAAKTPGTQAWAAETPMSLVMGGRVWKVPGASHEYQSEAHRYSRHAGQS